MAFLPGWDSLDNAVAGILVLALLVGTEALAQI